MARGRMINTTIALDPEFNALSPAAQLLFMRTIPHLDRDGLVIGQPTALWAQIAPLMPDYLPLMAGAIDEWAAAGFVRVIPTKIGPVLYFNSFHTNQVGMRWDREPASRIPLPDGIKRTPDGLEFNDGDLTANCRKNDGNPPSNGRPEVEVEVEVEREGGGLSARAHSVAAPTYVLPPQRAGQPINFGNPTGKSRREQIVTDAYMSQARQLGIEPAEFTAATNDLASICGKRSYIDAVDDDGTLSDIKGAVISLARLGYGRDKYDAVRQDWREANPWMDVPIPSTRQLVKHAALMKDGQAERVEPAKRTEQDAYRESIARTTASIQRDVQRTMEKFGKPMTRGQRNANH